MVKKEPCTVCHSPSASNFHFGARSCKACAAFFRRSIAMRQNYDCLGDNKKPCVIDYNLRLNCRHCRLEKCLNAGMIKDLVQAKRELPPMKMPQKLSPITVEEPVDFQPSTSSYFPPQFPQSDNEWDYSPPHKKSLSFAPEELMGLDELQQFITVDSFAMSEEFPEFPETRSRIDSFCSSEYFVNYEEEERIYKIAELYTDQVLNMNQRRKITYTEKMFGAVFDGACICPYEKSDLKLFDHRTYRNKNRNDYTMVLDYVNRFPEFQQLTKSEKTVLFRTAAAVDVLVDQAFYSQLLFPTESIMVTANGEYMSMDPLPNPDNEKSSGKKCFVSEEDFNKYKALTLMKLRQWQHVVQPLKKLNLSLPEFALFKALTIWHYNYYKLQENGKQVCSRQRDEIIRAFLIVCDDEGHPDALLRTSEIVLSVGTVMAEVHEMVTQYIEITVLDVLDDPILKDMLKFEY